MSMAPLVTLFILTFINMWNEYPEATEKAKAAWKAKNIDVTPFTIHIDEKTTFLFPITDYASQIEGIMEPAMDNVLTGKAPVESLTEANNQVNQLFG